ncbi:hypothetical protein JZ751_019216 [Albula glossodonta]|uniref:Uncharacterized protein n=1 Tax=Albula glossodonta TaxID=121402 RepID=A0A8T2NV62_9TELE|nr:hypothetical protein JZ751_019216 [Albula glossodonta]
MSVSPVAHSVAERKATLLTLVLHVLNLAPQIPWNGTQCTSKGQAGPLVNAPGIFLSPMALLGTWHCEVGEGREKPCNSKAYLRVKMSAFSLPPEVPHPPGQGRGPVVNGL